MKNVIKKIFAVCLLFNLYAVNLSSNNLFAYGKYISNERKKIYYEKKLKQLKDEDVSVKNFKKSDTVLMSFTTPSFLDFVNKSNKNSSHTLKNSKNKYNNYVRDYFMIGLKNKNSENDPKVVEDFISDRLAAQGIYSFTVFKGYGVWTEKKTKVEKYEPSLIFFVDGKQGQNEKINYVIRDFLNAKDKNGNSEFGQISVLHSTIPLSSVDLVYKNSIKRL